MSTKRPRIDESLPPAGAAVPTAGGQTAGTSQADIPCPCDACNGKRRRTSNPAASTSSAPSTEKKDAPPPVVLPAASPPTRLVGPNLFPRPPQIQRRDGEDDPSRLTPVPGAPAPLSWEVSSPGTLSRKESGSPASNPVGASSQSAISGPGTWKKTE